MAGRPKRECTERTRERIAKILEWENCSEKSAMFKNAAAKMEQEFRLGVSSDSVHQEDSSDGLCASSSSTRFVKVILFV